MISLVMVDDKLRHMNTLSVSSGQVVTIQVPGLGALSVYHGYLSSHCLLIYTGCSKTTATKVNTYISAILRAIGLKF